MSILPFKKPKKKSLVLCHHGHHKWRYDKSKEFEVKQGKLVTVYRCSRCGKTKVKSH